MKQAERLGKASRDQRAKGRSKRCTNSVYALERVQQQLHKPLGFSARLYSLNLSISVTSCLSKSCLHEWPPYAVAIRTNLCLLAYRTKRYTVPISQTNFGSMTYGYRSILFSPPTVLSWTSWP